MPRFTGKNAALYLNAGSGWAWVPDVYDINLDLPQVSYPARIKGDRITRRVSSHIGEAKVTVRRWVTGTSSLAVHAVSDIPTIDGSTHAFAAGTRLDWAIVGVDPNFPTGGDPTGFSGNANIKAQGTGYVESGRIGFPREHIEDEFVISVDTLVTVQ